jgi:hypothetical protein
MVALLTTATTVQTVVSFFGGGNAGTRGLVTASTEVCTFISRITNADTSLMVDFRRHACMQRGSSPRRICSDASARSRAGTTLIRTSIEKLSGRILYG